MEVCQSSLLFTLRLLLHMFLHLVSERVQLVATSMEQLYYNILNYCSSYFHICFFITTTYIKHCCFYCSLVHSRLFNTIPSANLRWLRQFPLIFILSLSYCSFSTFPGSCIKFAWYPIPLTQACSIYFFYFKVFIYEDIYCNAIIHISNDHRVSRVYPCIFLELPRQAIFQIDRKAYNTLWAQFIIRENSL